MDVGYEKVLQNPEFEESFLTSEIEIKIEPDDFIVEEEPLPDNWPFDQEQVLPPLAVPQDVSISILRKELMTRKTNVGGYTASYSSIHRQSAASELYQRTFECIFCDQRYSSLSSLDAHRELSCVPKLFIPCNLCKEVFKFKENLDNHLRVVHNVTHPVNNVTKVSNPVLCSTCGKMFQTEYSLNLHEIVHKNELKNTNMTKKSVKDPLRIKSVKKNDSKKVKEPKNSVVPNQTQNNASKNLSQPKCFIPSTSHSNSIDPFANPSVVEYPKESVSNNTQNQSASKNVSKPKCLVPIVPSVSHGNSKVPFKNPNVVEYPMKLVPIHTEIPAQKETKISNLNQNPKVKEIKPVPNLIETSLKCYICKKLFMKESDLKLHIVTNHTFQYHCHICGDKYRSKNDFESHNATLHPVKVKVARLADRLEKCTSKKEIVSCDECEKIFYASNIRLNYKSLKDKIEQHIVLKHLNRIELYKCAICNEKFHTCFLLNEHLDLHDRYGLLYKCLICNNSMASKDKLSNHLHIYHNLPDIIRVEDIIKLDVSTDSEKEEEIKDPYAQYAKSIFCQFCNRKYKNWQSARLHTIRDHLKVERYFCDICKQGFYHKGDIVKHITKSHFGFKNYTCSACKYKCFHRKELREHFRKKHGKIKRFACNDCDKVYPFSSSLRLHKFNVHNSEENHGEFRCKECNFAYAQLEQLNRHNINYHIECFCDNCEVRYYGKTRLRKHIIKFNASNKCKLKRKLKSGSKTGKKTRKESYIS